ncbi:MAG: hypothetical protein HY681_11735 [Chloroflexi bacterium]|nr:hypothetical protein [Chloroflexota bacterium]
MLTVTFRAADPADVAAPLPLSVVAIVDYTRTVSDGETSTVYATQREIQLSNTAMGSLTVDDYDGPRTVRAAVRSASGDILLPTRDVAVAAQDGGFAGEVAFITAEVKTMRDSVAKAPAPAAYAVRSGQFVVLDNSDMDFARRRLLVGLCPGPELATLKTALKDVLPKKLDAADVALLGALGVVQLHWVKLGLDGGFDFQLPAKGTETGWVWVLTGAEPWIGLQEDIIADERAEVVITLAPAQGGGAGADGKKILPQDVSEAELLRNADLFGDDPGTSCQPFQNRYRILSERTIHSILRVEQPEIGGEPSVTVQPPMFIDPPRVAELPSVRALAARPGFFARLDNAARVLVGQPAAAAPANLAALRTRLGERLRWVRQRSRGRQTMDAAHPAEWEGDASIYQATSVARGHILEFRVRWRSNGYSLGNVAHSLTLAPRQVKRITMVDWSRREATSRTERTTQRDELEQTTARDRDYTDVVSSQLNEWSKGGSNSSQTGAAGGIGFALGPVVIGGGAAHGRASADSWQKGGRTATAQEEQSLRDAVRQFGDSLRQLESTVVQETTQEETAIGVSEIIRNPNYCHALTIVYHEILRHLRIDTELVGVRECVFVPFAIRPFTVERALRWRDEIRARLIDRDMLWVMRYLEDIMDDFASSSIPAGPRATHPITYVSGSLFLQLSIERPRNDAADAFVEQNWLPLTRFLGMSPLTAFARLRARVEAERERVFQQEMAPQIASQWVNTLTIQAGGIPLAGMDFALATKYRPNGVVRVDFSLAPGTLLTRNQLQQLHVMATQALPSGSVANLQRVTVNYHTAMFQHQAASASVLDDLVDPATGAPDTLGASKFLQTDAFERQDLRTVIRAGAERLVNHLNEHVEYYHKTIWWHLDRDKLYMLLDGFFVPGGDGRSIASVVERAPMAILGNALVFRVAAGAFIGTDAHKSPEDLFDYYRPSDLVSEPLRVSLPTSGLYAQALKDPCQACEEHFGTTDWVLSDREPELETIGVEGLRTRRAEPPGVTPAPMGPTLINMPAVPEAPAPAGFADLLRAVTTANAFRDMAGLAQTQANAAAAMQQAATLASDFGSKAVEVRRAEGATQQAPQKLANIERAKAGNLIDDKEATEQAKQTLGDMHAREPERLTAEQPVQQILQRAAGGGGSIAVKRGMESVEMTDAGASFTYSVPDDVPLVAQPTGMTCWAAVGTMMLSWRDQVSYTIQAAMDIAGANWRALFDAGSGLPAAQHQQYAADCGMTVEAPQSYTVEGVKALLEDYGPIVVITDEQPGPNWAIHARVVIGIYGDGTHDGTFLKINDPNGGRSYDERFSSFAQKFEEVAGAPRFQVMHF